MLTPFTDREGLVTCGSKIVMRAMAPEQFPELLAQLRDRFVNGPMNWNRAQQELAMDFSQAASHLNWLAILVAPLAGFVIGGIWYGPLFR